MPPPGTRPDVSSEASSKRSRQRRIKLVVLEVRPSNTEARTLYESFGFRVVGRRRGYYYDTGEDALVMEADLQTANPGTRA